MKKGLERILYAAGLFLRVKSICFQNDIINKLWNDA